MRTMLLFFIAASLVFSVFSVASFQNPLTAQALVHVAQAGDMRGFGDHLNAETQDMLTNLGFNILSDIQGVTEFFNRFTALASNSLTNLGFAILDDAMAVQEFADRFGGESQKMLANLGDTLLTDFGSSSALAQTIDPIMQTLASTHNTVTEHISLLDQYIHDDFTPDISVAITFSRAAASSLTTTASTAEPQKSNSTLASANSSGQVLGVKTIPAKDR